MTKLAIDSSFQTKDGEFPLETVNKLHNLILIDR